MEDHAEQRPMLTAVSSSARQLYLLLRCISFAGKAQVQLSGNGMRFGVDKGSEVTTIVKDQVELLATLEGGELLLQAPVVFLFSLSLPGKACRPLVLTCRSSACRG